MGDVVGCKSGYGTGMEEIVGFYLDIRILGALERTKPEAVYNPAEGAQIGAKF